MGRSGFAKRQQEQAPLSMEDAQKAIQKQVDDNRKNIRKQFISSFAGTLAGSLGTAPIDTLLKDEEVQNLLANAEKLTDELMKVLEV